ncbi:hypothetical protein A4U49_15475 [Acidithiobacillus ferrivorans]|jgi:DNA-binding transcriptional regulator YdaS (Cro superfamily)|uniref:helix-turn-helix domain-containing protein n=1 Tax=Acidithiobacillus ferrivorans TaxID=160808 RepID=UPI000893584F|nr:helix-turn-helix domain-containing protein [Acidithiobacillus ferrivorans]OFA14977.1 hypothetical protein A4U49_15475 [Acidithiobacillus ferrivorans]
MSTETNFAEKSLPLVRILGGPRKVGRALGISGQAVNMWKEVPLSRVEALCAAFSGLMPHDLRPDLFAHGTSVEAACTWIKQQADRRRDPAFQKLAAQTADLKNDKKIVDDIESELVVLRRSEYNALKLLATKALL